MSDTVRVARVGDGVYRVEHEGRGETVYVADTSSGTWAFWNGHVFRDRPESGPGGPARLAVEGGPGPVKRHLSQLLIAPMPATVIKVLVQPGSPVHKGDTIVVLEAMKMELPIRALGDGTVTAVHCREGDLVQPDASLVEIE